MSSLPADAIDEPGRSPNFVRDISAIVLIAVTLILTVSILTRDPADPIDAPVWPLDQIYQPDVTVYPTNETITNACGYWGALLSQLMFDSLGLATAIVIAAGGGIATALLTRGQINAPVLRSLGGCVVIVGVATAAGLYQARWAGMPVVGNGGYLGAMTSTWLSEHFAPMGAWILTLTVLAVGLLMATDYALLYAGKRVASSGAMLSKHGLRRAARVMPIEIKRRRQPFTDLEQPIVLDGEEPPEPETEETEAESEVHEPKIKFHSKKLTKKNTEPEQADEPEEEDWGEEYEVDGAEEEEETPEPVTREIELDDETVTLRQDEAHPVSSPKVKLPQRKPSAKEELYNSINDNAPSDSADYLLPSVQLLEAGDDICYDDQLVEVRRKAQVLEETFRNFGFNVRVVEIETGPVIAQYEIELEAGLRLSKISGLADDIAIALRVPSVRIVAPIPGKNTVGIEVPNETRQVVYLRDVIEESDTRSAKMNIPVFLGKDVSGNPMVVDLAKMPHLLIAGRTGTGKSVCLNAIISSILMTCKPDEVRMLMIDPKMVELSGYGRLPHLMHPVITDMKKAEAILAWAVDKMEERYSLLAKAGVRHINSFNDLGREEVLRRLEVDEADGGADVPDKLPFIVIVADEMADLMMTAGKDVEQHIIRLAQKSRAVGIHLILATQKPTVDVITGLIKSNLPARLSFQVASKTDSRVVLDENGADKLLGNGDMLFLWPGTSTLIRGQGTYLSDDEIDRVCDHCSMGEQSFVGELMNLKVDEDVDAEDMDVANMRKKDELYESAIEVVIREGRGSLSLIQRCLGVGYGRAARLVDYMAEDGIVGEYNGSKSREVLLTMDQWLKMQGLDPEDTDGEDDSGSTSTATVKAKSKAISPAKPPQKPAAKAAPIKLAPPPETDQSEDEEEEEYEDDESYAEYEEEYEDYEEEDS